MFWWTCKYLAVSPERVLLKQSGTLSSSRWCSVGRYKIIVIVESINPWIDLFWHFLKCILFCRSLYGKEMVFWKTFLLISSSVLLNTKQIHMFSGSVIAWHFLVLVKMRFSSHKWFGLCSDLFLNFTSALQSSNMVNHGTFCSTRCTQVSSVLFSTVVFSVAVMPDITISNKVFMSVLLALGKLCQRQFSQFICKRGTSLFVFMTTLTCCV